MMEIFWMMSGAAAVAVWVYRTRQEQDNKLGVLSVRWLHEYRRETHHEW